VRGESNNSILYFIIGVLSTALLLPLLAYWPTKTLTSWFGYDFVSESCSLRSVCSPGGIFGFGCSLISFVFLDTCMHICEKLGYDFVSKVWYLPIYMYTLPNLWDYI
jgi:hypothetical protein